MTLDPDACYSVLSTRDERFDGRFFVGVRSTGIYCRPICPAVTPKRKNCVFLPCAAAAQDAGFRPCLRCRPEAAPGTPAWLGTSTTVTRALRLIEEGALDRESVDELAGHLGVGERHLRRLFLQHVGASPKSVADTRRLLFAKRLLDETALPMAEVAFGAGFSSVRRFNDAFRKTYGESPSSLRGRKKKATPSSTPSSSDICLHLAYRPPFDWAALRDFLALRAIPGVESVANNHYRRSVRIGDRHGVLEVSPVDGKHQLRARLMLPDASPLADIHQRVRRIFDLAADPAVISKQLARDRALRPLLRARPGLRVPGAWDGFELAVRAIVGQQVSVRGASTLAGRIAERFGEPLQVRQREGSSNGAASHGRGRRSNADGRGETADNERDDSGVGELRFVFPSAEVLANADLRGVGLTEKRIEAIVALANAVATGEVVLDSSADLDSTLDRLRALPGIGDWTAQYIAMRALSCPNAFPASDLILRRALARGGKLPTPRAVKQMAGEWSPWQSYAALYLWTVVGPTL